MGKQKVSDRERSIRRYFSHASGTWLIVLGLVVLVGGYLFALDRNGRELGALALLLGLVLLPVGIWRLASSLSRPSDGDIDLWLDQGINRLKSEAYKKLGIEEGDITARDGPLVVRGPILSDKSGIDSSDLVWRKGKDSVWRFGAYQVLVICLTDRHLGAYRCDYDFVTDFPLNEYTDEFHYSDVVSVSTTNSHIDTDKLGRNPKWRGAENYKVTLEEFRVSVSSGDSIGVSIGSVALKRLTGSERLPESGADQAVAVIRQMLRDKKP